MGVSSVERTGMTAGRWSGRGSVFGSGIVRGSAILTAGLLVSLGGAVPAAAQDGAAHLVIISGLSGEERFARDYLSWGVQLLEAAESRLDVPAANIVWLAEDADAHAAIRARSTKAGIERDRKSV